MSDEERSRFDLEKAIASWRHVHGRRRVFLTEDLDELERHLRDHTAYLVKQGERPEAAFRAAQQALGDVEGGEAEYRKVRWGKLRRRHQVRPEISYGIAMLKSNLSVAVRNVRKHKLYSSINVLGLTIGVACCLLIGLYVLHERSYDRFHAKADRVYRLLYHERQGTGVPRPAADEYLVWGSAAHAPLLEADFPEIERAVRLSGRHEVLVARDDRRFQEERYFFADPAFFEVFSFPLLRGNPETVLAGPRTAVLSETAARRYFGDADPIGQTLSLESGEGQGDVTVSGIMADVPANSHLDFDILFSMDTFEQRARDNDQAYKFDARGYADFFTYVLLKEGTSAEMVAEKLPEFVQRHYAEGLKDPPRSYGLALEPLTEAYHSPAGRRQPLHAGPMGNPTNLYLFSFIGLFILVIACFNFTNLATARSVGRAKEVGVRKTVGASRGGLIGQFLVEAILLTSVATVIAALLAWVLLPLFRTLAGKEISALPLWDPAMIAAILGGAVLLGLFAGAYPAFVLSRFRPSQVLKGTIQTSGAGLRKAMVAFQFMMSIALIVGTVVVHDQLEYLRDHPLGFEDRQQLVLDFGGDPRVRDEIEAVKQEFEALPGIDAASAARSVPGGYFPDAGSAIEAPDGTMRDVSLGLFEVDQEFLTQLGVEVVAGRLFSPEIATDTEQALVVNAAAAREMGYADPAELVGKRFRQWGREGEIVGVVDDFNFESLQHEVTPLSFRVSPWLRFLVLETSTADAAETVALVQARWNELVPYRPFMYSFLDQSFDALYRDEDRFGALFGTFAALAIFIACLGLFGLAAYSVQQRTKEIGIRKALGATAASVAALFSRDFLKLVLVGFVVAVPVAYLAMSRWLDGFAYRIDIGPGIFLLAGGLALLVAVLTVSYQSARAARLDPVKTLRYE